MFRGKDSETHFGPKSTTESALSSESTLTPHLPLTTTTVSSLTSSTAFPETTTTTTAITSSTTPPLKCAKMWSPWTKWGPCTEKCGGCGEKIRFQKCKKLDLPVEGCVCPSTNFKEEKAKCAFKACPPPASPCCNGHLPSGFDSNGMAICGVGSVPENVFEEFENME
ncbi:hypothetical protein L596_030726 [Steinernema carpocapsae]|uniref:Uncharacterized protein n=1 Tax=Steinernema carpocapsae TaxID=34508 RepID=A0A4U5LNN2_STECR|nr:hypothetical protein L596_030726 [Steinernema carpocapsae]